MFCLKKDGKILFLGIILKDYNHSKTCLVLIIVSLVGTYCKL